jgi:hypothetical protein
VVTPDGAEWPPRPRVDNAMVKALARAFRWRKMLDDGVHARLEDLARAKGVNATSVSRLLRLTLLAPEIVEAILDGRQPAGLQLGTCKRDLRWSGSGSTEPVPIYSLGTAPQRGEGRGEVTMFIKSFRATVAAIAIFGGTYVPPSVLAQEADRFRAMAELQAPEPLVGSTPLTAQSQPEDLRSTRP